MRKAVLHKVLSVFTTGVFLFNSLSSGLDLSQTNNTNLAPPSIFQKSLPLENSKKFKESILSDMKFLTTAFSIAAHFLIDGNDEEKLATAIRNEFRNNRAILDYMEELKIDVGKNRSVHFKNDIVNILFEKAGKSYEARIYAKEKFESADMYDSEWAVSSKFGIQVVRRNPNSTKQERMQTADGKHNKGSVSNSLVERLNANGDINYWDDEIKEAARNDPSRKNIRILLERGENRLKVLHLDVPSVLFTAQNKSLCIRYVAASIYNESVCNGATNVVIFMPDKQEEKSLADSIKRELKTRYERMNIYANFGEDIRIGDSSNFNFDINKRLRKKLAISPKPEEDFYSVGIDVGGTNIKVVVMYGTEVVETFSTAVDREKGGEHLKKQIMDTINSITYKLGGKAIKFLGITFPSPVKNKGDNSFNIVRMTNFERFWGEARGGNTDFTEDYKALNSIADEVKRHGIENVAILNDADAFGFGELYNRTRNGIPVEKMGAKVILPIGTGPGYVMINNGDIENIPNQGGHMVIDLSDNASVDPGCGVKGCYGGYVPASVFSLRAKAHGIDISHRETLQPTDAQAILALLKDMASRIAIEAVKLNKITGANEVILAGGVSQGWTGKELARLANENIKELYPMYKGRVKVTLSTFDINYGGAIGAARYAVSLRKSDTDKPAWDMTHGLPSTNVGKNNIQEFFANKENEKICIVATQELLDFMERQHYPWFEKIKASGAVLPLDGYKEPSQLETVIEQQRFSTIVAIGAGTVTDWGKFAGKRLKKKVVSIPSALSANGMFTEKAIFYSGSSEDRKRESLVSGPPDEVIIDLHFLRDLMHFKPSSGINGERANRAGVGDIVSIYPALLDWKLAAENGKEPIDETIFTAAQSVLDLVVSNSEDIRDNTDLGMVILAEAMAEASLLNMRYGTSRPKDGSEHLLGDEIDRRLPTGFPRLHCEIVAISSLIMGYLYSTEYDPRCLHDIRDMLRAFELPTHPDEIGIPKEVIVEALMNVHTRPDKYTFFDRFGSDITRERADLIYERVFGSKQDEIERFRYDVSYYVNNSVKAMFNHIKDNVIPYIDADKTKELIRLLVETKKKGGRVIINAAGRVGEVAVFFQQKLRALGYNVDDFQEITPEFLVNKDDLVLTFSGSGKTYSVINNLKNVERLHREGKLNRQIFSITANPSAETWEIGKSYHSVMTIKGRTKEETDKVYDAEGAKYLPLSSTFEYSVMLYLEGIVEALIKDGENLDKQEIVDIVKNITGNIPASIKEELKEKLMQNEILTTKFINLLMSTLELTETDEVARDESGNVITKQRIYLFGLGQNNYVIRLFARRMQNIGFEIYVPGPRDIVSRPHRGDIAVFVSNSGARAQIEEKMLVAKELKCPTVLITATPHSPLANQADIVIPISRRTTVSHTADIMIDDKECAEERNVKRTFEIASMFYLEGISVALMKILRIEGKDLQHVPKQWELKGPAAPESNPIIEDIISKDNLIELAVEENELKAYTINYVKGYRPGLTGPNTYRGSPRELDTLFSGEELNKLKEWIITHKIKEKYIKFRVAMGQTAIGWENDISHSNIAHAGVRDSAIYIGGLLLRHILKEENNVLSEEILDKDEFRHLEGLDHGTDEEYQKRLQLVEPAAKKLEETRQAMLKDNWKYLFNELRSLLEKQEETSKLLSFLSACNEVSLSQPRYPVESRYPILRAATLLSAEEQAKLTDILQQHPDLRRMPLIDSILLMLDENIPEDWLSIQAPNLHGRTIWQVASEIWFPLGGLGRVMQYHGVEMNELLKYDRANLRHIEPFYHLRRDKSGKLIPIEYSSLPIPLTSHKLVAKFPIKVGDETTEAFCYRVRNPFGVETYLIRDKEWKYTKMAYNYSSEDNPVSWEDFSEFFSRASLELVRYIEQGSKKRSRHWKPPVIHTNDAQVALFDLFKQKFYSDDKILKDSIIAFTTHTYFHRQIYDRATGESILRGWGISEEEWQYFHHMAAGWHPVYDVTSAGSRTADWRGGVSKKHVDDVAQYDAWKGVQLIAVTNGDLRAYTAKNFREIMLGFFPEVDMDHPTAQQVLVTKKEAKRRLGLDPDKYVVSYSGRLVPEKAGRQRAFTDENIEALVKMGVQVIIYGNMQPGDSRSRQLNREFADLSEKLKAKNYPGRFVFVNNFDLDDQRSLLAATDIQIQDSDHHTEAAGYTEADISSCGGLELAPAWDEGILQAQGIRINTNIPGEGNTLIPENEKPEAYLKILKEVLSKTPDELSEYQATSIRLSRVLDARLTAAEYLRQFSNAAAKKEAESEEEEGAVSKANVRGALHTIYYSELKDKTDISVETDFMPRRPFGRTSVYTEIRMLKALGILVEGAKPHTYQLQSEIRGLSMPEIEEILAIPALNRYEISEDKIPAVKANVEMLILHHINTSLLPPVEDGKILWHVIPVGLIPESIRSQFVSMVRNMNNDYPNLREKILIVTDRQDLHEKISELDSDPHNIVDAAVQSRKDLEKLPPRVKALVFSGRLADFRQLEGIIAALRALQQSNARALIELYEILTGTPFTKGENVILDNIEHPQILADIIMFNLKPITIRDYDDLRNLNRNLLKLIQAA